MEYSRRSLIKVIVAGGSTITIDKLPAKWTTPIVDKVILPAHGQTSRIQEFGGGIGVDSTTLVDSLVTPAHAATDFNGGCVFLRIDGQRVEALVQHPDGETEQPSGELNDDMFTLYFGEGSVLQGKLIRETDGTIVSIVGHVNGAFYEATRGEAGSCPTVCVEPEVDSPQVFDIPGNYEFVVPAGVTLLQITAIGGDGGNGIAGDSFPEADIAAGGAGGTANTEDLVVTPGETLVVCVGGAGGNGQRDYGILDNGGASSCGYEGGGGAGSVRVDGTHGTGGGGGGASLLFRESNALLVAGGGGGGGGSISNFPGGDGEGGCGSGGSENQAGANGGYDRDHSGGGGGGGGVEGGAGGAQGYGDNSGEGGRGGTCGGSAISHSTPGASGGGNGRDGNVTISWVACLPDS